MMTTLTEELTNDPLGLGYAGMTNGEIETAMNTKNRSRIISRFVTARTILAECADGAAILDKLEAADYDMFNKRPVLKPYDWVIMLAKSAPF